MRYLITARAPHPFDLSSIPENVQQLFRDVSLKPIHTDLDGSWQIMPGTHINLGKRLLMFEALTDEVTMQNLLDSNGLSNFKIVDYRTEQLFPDPLSTEENPLPNRAIYSSKASKIDLIDWMEDEYVPDPVDPINNPSIAQRPTELKMNIVHGTGQRDTLP